MSTFKSRAEIAAALEFIQYLEQAESGSLAANKGVNRTLERLAENLNAVLDAVQTAKGVVFAGGGTVTWNSGTGVLAWSADIEVYMPNEIGTGTRNTIPAGNVTLGTTESTAYVILDRGAVASVSPVVVASMAAFVAAITGQAARLDWHIVARRTPQGVIFCGRHIRDGYGSSNNLFTDTQYGQQTEVTSIRGWVKDNLNLILTRGGNLSWDSGTGTFTWSSDLILEFPQSAGNNTIAAGNVVIPAGSCAYVTLSRDPAVAVAVAMTVVAVGSVPDNDNAYVIAVHKVTDGRLYLCNGQALSDGETVLLGGVRTGLQWLYKQFGTSVQATDFTEAGTYPNRAYTVGSGELMVYRNGVKARASNAVWNGTYPAGALSGALNDADEYVEEDPGRGSGTRVLWVADKVGAETLFHGAATHDPVWTWPEPEDSLEAFVGIHGEAPGTVEPGDLAYLQGFEIAYTTSVSNIRIAGGALVSPPNIYRAFSTNPVDCTPADMFGADVLVPSAWHYVYVGPGASPGDPPVMKLSVTPPAKATGYGSHPSNSAYKFLTSVFVTATSTFSGFSKYESWITLGRKLAVDAAFASAVSTGFVAIDMSPYVPGTGVTSLQLVLQVQVAGGVTNGSRVRLRYRSPGNTSSIDMWALKPTNSTNVQFQFEVPLNGDEQFEIELNSTDFTAGTVTADVVGYAEGRTSTSTAMGA